MQRVASKILAFCLGGVFAFLMNTLTWPDSSAEKAHHARMDPLAAETLQKTAAVQDFGPVVGDASVVGKDTYRFLKTEWVDANKAVPSQQEIATSCQTRLLVLVMSDSRHNWKREAVRDSWAVDVARYSPFKVNKGDFKYVFILGRLFDQIPDKVTQEAHKTQDIVVSDVNDYDITGATNKTVWALNWALKHCTFTHVMKTMDHAFVNIPLVIGNWLPRMDAGNFYAGLRLSDVTVNRNPDRNWYISEQDYPREKYPVYTQQDFVLSRDVAEGLVKTMNKTLLQVYYDDVAVAYALNLSRPQLTIQHEPNVVHLCTPAVSRPYVVLKVLEASDMRKYGRDMFNKQIICHLGRH